jgi:hypothetical protein
MFVKKNQIFFLKWSPEPVPLAFWNIKKKQKKISSKVGKRKVSGVLQKKLFLTKSNVPACCRLYDAECWTNLPIRQFRP